MYNGPIVQPDWKSSLDIIGLKLSYLFFVYGAVILVSVSFQYFCLRRKIDFMISLLGPLGIFLFGLFSTLYSLDRTPLMKLWSQGGLGLLMGSLSSLLILHFNSSPSVFKRQVLLIGPLMVALLAMVIYQYLGGGAGQLFFISLILLTALFVFPNAPKFRLAARFYFFFSFLFILGSLCFFVSQRFFFIDLLEGLFLFLSFIFAYQTVIVLMASSFIHFKLGEGR